MASDPSSVREVGKRTSCAVSATIFMSTRDWSDRSRLGLDGFAGLPAPRRAQYADWSDLSTPGLRYAHHMFAARYTGNGPPDVVELPMPAPAPSPGHVQLEVAYTGICGTDLHIL